MRNGCLTNWLVYMSEDCDFWWFWFDEELEEDEDEEFEEDSES